MQGSAAADSYRWLRSRRQATGDRGMPAPGEVPRIRTEPRTRRKGLRRQTWRIACCFVGKGHRRQSVFAAGLAGAVDLIADLGGGRVEGYPEDANAVPAGFLFHGALSTYEQLGFVRVRKIGKHRWVLTRVVNTAAI